MKSIPAINHRSTHRKVQPYKEEFLRRHLGRPRRLKLKRGQPWLSIGAWNAEGSNILGVGYGLKETAGAGVPTSSALRIYVRKKLPKSRLSRKDIIRDEINGLPTDVIPLLSIQPAARPAFGGHSGAHRNARPGTLGCLVRDRHNGASYILSCYHVLADEDDPVFDDDVFEPALPDGGVTPIGALQRWMNLNPRGNLVDCGVARILNPGDFVSEIRNLGQPDPNPLQAALHQTVKKSGRNSPHVTLGVVDDVSADVLVDYRRGPVSFVQQIAIRGVGGLFAEQGDSGSLVLEAGSLRPIGLLFAVSNQRSFANPIQTVLDELEVDIS